MLAQLSPVVTPDTILRWHRELVAAKWDYSEHRKKIGRPAISADVVEMVLRMARENASRPPVSTEIVELVLRMASENPGWGYDRIQGALANLGHLISNTCVRNILKAHGIDPAPDQKRQSTWKSFLQYYWDVLASVDFTTIEVWTKNGLTTIYLIFFMELTTRREHFAGSTAKPGEAWMIQIARNVSDAEVGFLRDKNRLLMDRDTKFSKEFRDILEDVDIEAIRLPARSPNLNPHLERFMRSIKEECLERMIFFGEKSLHATTLSYIDPYHAERNHQGVGNQLLIPGNEVNRTAGEVACRERPGGLLRYYYPKSGMS